MQRYQLVIGGTIAGIAGVLAFPTHSSTHLTIPSAGATGTTTGGTSGTSAAPAASTGGSAATSAAPSGTTAGSAATTTPATPAVRTATSDDTQFRYGDLAVKVTVNGSKITNVAVTTLNEFDGRSASIDHYSIPYLEQQVIQAGSVNINGVSGATFTSQAFVDAVANALQKLGIQP